MSVLRVRLTRGQALRGLIFRKFVDSVRGAVERAGLPVARNRRGAPRLEAGPHLAPAHTSRCEYIDFELTDPITGREFLRRLSMELPAGVDAVSARRLPPGSKNLKAAVRVLRYRVAGDFRPEQAERFRRASSWPVVRIRKGQERCLDLRRSVARLDVGPGEVTMEIEVRVDGTPRPEEVIASVFGIPLEAALLLETERSGMLLSGTSPARP
ncbi:MAG TPA: TIGR03936 family radical SAM-associated protein [Candidatus Hydrogenedentes bacterium]|mgnify:CR=1 FL=1|jgi:radical SAM-linked protein|nr:TIGR03936 family radical SAM-associated protein [Candidatus Hydrogenedentota bacterium]HPJ97985.1 TIGR03936 family radical SAM-associated protein [Candidatus Hydrogenedentota bacterium]